MLVVVVYVYRSSNSEHVKLYILTQKNASDRIKAIVLIIITSL